MCIHNFQNGNNKSRLERFMDTFRAMSYFVNIAESGNFKRTADEFGCSTSLISKEISKLESSVNARLLQRSTRKVQLTEIGAGYLEHCKKILQLKEQSIDYVQDMQGTAKGVLKVNAPMTLGLTDLAAAFGAFSAQHPEIELDVDLSDNTIDLIKQGFDVGFRASSTGVDSNYIGKPIYTFTLHIVTSPQYLQQIGGVDSPQSLSALNCFVYSLAMNKDMWPIDGGVKVSGSIKANNTIFLREALLQGQGVGLVPSFVCKEQLKSGELIELFPEHKLPRLSFYVLYPSREHTPVKLMKFVDFMTQWFKSQN